MSSNAIHQRGAGRRRGNRQLKSSAALAGAFAALIAAGLTSSAQAQVFRSGSVYYTHACPPVSADYARCESFVVTDSHGRLIESTKPPVAGLTPAQLRNAYAITANGKSSTIIAIVDAFGYTNAETDLGTYRSEFQLPACTTANGCFKKLNQEGNPRNYPAQNIGWAQESALDLDMASTMCPNCTIYLIEAKTNSGKNLGKAVNTAASLGAHVISNSYCGRETKRTKAIEQDYNHAGIAVTAANGDDGYGVCTPASNNAVVAVGGTHLVTDTNARGWTETVWSGTGSGCSKIFSKPDWQTDTGCAKRTIGDTAADADPATGVAVYGPNNSGDSAWLVFGGTSVATPLVGGVFGANGGTVNAASTIYVNTGDLFDVTSGSNGTCDPAYLCTGEVGYDGPTGNGTPNGIGAFGSK